ncbi:hypothetical protein F4805DRAFT_334434 [Annulohypoxylon moriforme]|nr:hypothetical protein F4805DRAFT_334434 [Annulohypoxylon moriforme]
MSTVNSPQGLGPSMVPTPIPPPESANGQQLIAFLNPHVSAPNSDGHRLEEILEWDDERLQNGRGYMDWLFPVPYNSDRIDQQTLIYCRSSNEILWNMRVSFTRMMALYGFDVEYDHENGEGELRIGFPRNNRDSFKRWLKDTDHSHTRIARIFVCLRLFSLTDEAVKAYEAFTYVNELFGNPVSNDTLDIWTQSIDLPLVTLSRGYLNFQPRFFENGPY